MASNTVTGLSVAAAANASDEASRLYVNHLSVTISLSEVMLDFGQLFPSSSTARAMAKLVTSPVHLKRFGQQLEGTLRRYEASYGPLPVTEREGEG